MGQPIEVSPVHLGDVVHFDTDRSLTGQDGEAYSSVAEAGAGTTFAAVLAKRLIESDPSIDYVSVLSNAVTVRRADSWPDGSIESAISVIRDFFVFYEENKGAVAAGS